MTAEKLLERLEKVKCTGAGRWVARCPAHDDKHPSLAVTEKPDGIVLVKCFTGCGMDSIVGAVGLEPSDLFPDKPPEPLYEKAKKREFFHAKDVLAALEHEVLIVYCAANTIQRRGYLNDEEFERLGIASDRITGAMAYAGHG